MLNVGVLGPFRVRYRNLPVVPSAAKPRKVLALLALCPDRYVSVEALMEELWEERQPRSAATTLQTYVLQLRNLIAERLAQAHVEDAPGAKDILVTKPGGYLLNTHGGDVDVRDYRAKAAQGRRAAAAGDTATAALRLREALALWQGRALVDVQSGPRLTMEALYLEQSRLETLSLRVQADLALGRHHELMGELAGLCVAHPLDETFHAHYMTALCRAGRRGAALHVYRRLWQAMRRELGVTPSAAAARLHRIVLSGDPCTDWQPGTGARVTGAPQAAVL